MFLGFNAAFLPMHLLGLWGMPRRVYTYPAEMGWQTLNLIATAGAFTLAVGVFIFLVDLARNLRPSISESAGNVWNAGTLEWMPNHTFGMRSIPQIDSRYPLWQQPNLEHEVDTGRHYLPNAPTGTRETIITSPIEAMPQYVQRVSGPGWSPFLAAVFTAAFFMLLTVKWITVAVACGVLAVAFILIWTWSADPEPVAMVDVGHGVSLPAYMTGPVSHAWWATVLLMLVAGSLYLSLIFSYLYVWTVAPQFWPPDGASLPSPASTATVALLLLIAAGAMFVAGNALTHSRSGFAVLVIASVGALAAALFAEIAGHWGTGLRPDASGYTALVYLASVLQLQIVGAIVVMSCLVLARLAAGRLDSRRRVTFEVLSLMTHYAVGQGLLGLAVIHGFPRGLA
jgi:cytochrome c oxidase subunit I+III